MRRPRRQQPDETAPTTAKRKGSIQALRTAARTCRDCDLWREATQTVFGDGPARARIVLIGEQPGDHEDREGRPFVGPAGRLLDRALAEAGIHRHAVYVTNVVKHFKFEQRGKLRLHRRANAEEQAACRQWLDAELVRIKPHVVVCLGALAANAIFGRGFRLLAQRGQWQEISPGVRGFATVHPSYLLRMRTADRESAYRLFVRDLSLIKRRPVGSN